MNEAIVSGIFGFIGVIVGASISWLKESFNEHSQRSRNARYLAVRVICILDEFVDVCLNVALDNGEPTWNPSNGEESCGVRVQAPQELNFPNDLDWKSIDSKLMYEILKLPNQLSVTNRNIYEASDPVTLPDTDATFEARWEGYSNLGQTATRLVTKLRKTYKLPPPDLTDFNPQQIFEERKALVASNRLARYQALPEIAWPIMTQVSSEAQ
jgi:hypothetical protein